MDDEIKYQVFISSTYEDLKMERQIITRHIISLGYHPVGMEYFNLGNDSIWDHIKKLIESSDYYVLLLGARYGSEDDIGLSYTQKEFLYAKKLRKPIKVIMILDDELREKFEVGDRETREKQKKLLEFRRVVLNDGVEFWSGIEDFHQAVGKIGQWIAKTPTEGWVRGHIKSENQVLRYLFNCSSKSKNVEIHDKHVKHLPEKIHDISDLIQCIELIRKEYLLSRMPHSISAFFTYRLKKPLIVRDDFSGNEFLGLYRMALSSNRISEWRVGKYIGEKSSLHYSYQNGQSRVLPNTKAPAVGTDQKTVGEQGYCCIPIFYDREVVAHIGLSSPNFDEIQPYVKFAEETATIFETIIQKYQLESINNNTLTAQKLRDEFDEYFQ